MASCAESWLLSLMASGAERYKGVRRETLNAALLSPIGICDGKFEVGQSLCHRRGVESLTMEDAPWRK